ncbi:MAG: SDR family oxidoreductase [Coriobacteriales bacterium]|jgi:NAD(P)-dependent dehydrogenase (short-subunit alcohol dehydrogenase family)|nr:SDR family oxidoreductase [Coriobacteriales bacterium]
MRLGKLSCEGTVALVAGASSGIGKSSALLLAQAGAQVFLVARRAEKLEELKAAIEAAGGAADCFAADVSEESNCKAAVEACVERFGSVDVLVNSVGMNSGRIEDAFDTENYHKVIKVDLDATVFMVKYAYPLMSDAGGGSIINISSSAGVKAMVDSGIPYTASKGAIRSLSRMWGKQFAPAQVRVNSIYPGYILTEMTTGAFDNPEIMPYFTKDVPMGTIGEADDIGYCVLYLASSASKYVTGQDFIIDGGMTC